MSKFSLYNLLKSSAKTIAKELDINHNEALELVARKSGFSNLHELSVISRQHPMHSKLLMAIFGEQNLGSIIYCDYIYPGFEILIEDILSSEIAMTNASEFQVDNLGDPKWNYDDKRGKLLLKLEFEYNGVQDSDRVYCGSGFFVEAEMSLLWRNNIWNFVDKETKIISCISNLDIEYEMYNE